MQRAAAPRGDGNLRRVARPLHLPPRHALAQALRREACRPQARSPGAACVCKVRTLMRLTEICGLRWSPDGSFLASGACLVRALSHAHQIPQVATTIGCLFGALNQLCQVSTSKQTGLLVINPRRQFKSTPTTRPLSRPLRGRRISADWCGTRRNLRCHIQPSPFLQMCSGGGTADRSIRFRNILTNSSLHSLDSGSQVCNLSWSKNINEIVSTHGYSQAITSVTRAHAVRVANDGAESNCCLVVSTNAASCPPDRPHGTPLSELLCSV